MAAKSPSHGVAAEQTELKSHSAAIRGSDQQESARLKALDFIRDHEAVPGSRRHWRDRFEPVAFCVREGLVPDFYFKTLHHDRYWSAHPPENRRDLEMYEPNSDDHGYYHDNLFCDRPEATVALMQEVKVPWIAFKVLAAGAISPADGFQYAFDGGADFLCVGMFDFQIEEDVELIRRSFAAAQTRRRPWR